jgi:hypothetical protein
MSRSFKKESRSSLLSTFEVVVLPVSATASATGVGVLTGAFFTAGLDTTVLIESPGFK